MRRPEPSAVAPLILACMLLACEPTAPRGPGAIRVQSNATLAEDFDFFQYGIAIDGGTPRTVMSFQSENFLVNGLAHGSHTVNLSSLPGHCATGAAGNDREVSLRGDDTVTVSFSIACGRTTGDANIQVITTGSDLDDDGYYLTLNSFFAGFAPTNGLTTIPGLPPGLYTIGLSDVADNCTASGSQNMSITAGVLATVSFTVTCSPVAYVKIVAATSGDDRDPDGYVVSTGASDVRVPANAITHLRRAVGAVDYAILDLQPNCTLAGPSSGTATIAAGDTLVIDVAATCTSIPESTAGTAATDPVGDTLPNSTGGFAAHDVSNVTARYATGWLIMVVRFARAVTHSESGLPSALYGYVEIDADESAATGTPPITNAYGGSASIGVDVALLLFGGSATTTPLLKVTSTGTYDGDLVPTRYEGDSVTFYIPVEKLGGDGNVAAAMVVGTYDRPTDVAPNSGAFVASPAAPFLASQTARPGLPSALRGSHSRTVDYRHATGTWGPPRRD
ncbi:MAG: hypothetical protein WD801_14645 [Gemmatimonadaceae bacterium]